MLVTKVEELKNKKLSIEIEQEFFGVLYKAEAKQLMIEEGRSLSELQIKEMNTLLVKRGKKRVFYLLGKKDYTVHEIEVKLREGGLSDKNIEQVIAYFEKAHYLDDVQFMNKYVEFHRTKRSLRQMKYELQQKGISSQRITDFFEEIDNSEETTIDALIEKKLRGRLSPEDDEVEQKTIAYMMRKGFAYEQVRKGVERYKKGLFDSQIEEDL